MIHRGTVYLRIWPDVWKVWHMHQKTHYASQISIITLCYHGNMASMCICGISMLWIKVLPNPAISYIFLVLFVFVFCNIVLFTRRKASRAIRLQTIGRWCALGSGLFSSSRWAPDACTHIGCYLYFSHSAFPCMYFAPAVVSSIALFIATQVIHLPSMPPFQVVQFRSNNLWSAWSWSSSGFKSFLGCQQKLLCKKNTGIKIKYTPTHNALKTWRGVKLGVWQHSLKHVQRQLKFNAHHSLH